MKNMKVLKGLFAVVLTVVSFSLMAQNTTKTSTWKLFTEKNGVQVFYKYEDCHDNVNDLHEQNVILKFVNTTQMNMTIEWDLNVWYNNNQCVGCNDKKGEYHFKISVLAGQSVAGNCERTNENRPLKIYAKSLKYSEMAQMKKFDLANLTVNPQ